LPTPPVAPTIVVVAGEFEFIEWLRARQAAPAGLVLVPPGDDLAVLRWPEGQLLLVGADQVLDGVHFDSSVHTPRQIGRKAMNRNLSDCAAMACLPAAAVATVAAPRGVGVDYLKELYLGLREAGDAFGCPVVGGDTGSWGGKLALSVTILGRGAGIRPVTRSGARPGDLICVTGALGGSRLGRHIDFVPRVNEAVEIASVRPPTAMIDLSDGLSRDLGHICRESGVGAVVFEEKVPVHHDAVEMRRDGRSPLDHALHDGEDYELLFTMGRGELAFIRTVKTYVIGTMGGQPGVWLERRDGSRESLEPQGWEHGL
jgi:thiamine-monophosphate kinase